MLVVLAVLLPAALLLVFERQARRLDGLVERGVAVDGVITSVGAGTTAFAWRIDGVDYTWNVSTKDLPLERGASVALRCLPEDPSFCLPAEGLGSAGVDRMQPRSLGRVLALALALMLALVAWRTELDLRRVRRGEPLIPVDPRAYRRRVWWSIAAVLPAGACVTGFHARESLASGVSWPVTLLVVGLPVAFLGGVMFVMTKGGHEQARARSAKVLRWSVPLGAAIALVRLFAELWR